MSPLPLLIALSSVGIDAGWTPLKDGGLEYTVQIEPQQLKMLKPGEELVSEIPPKSRDIRRIRITVGTEKLARIDIPPVPEGQEKIAVAKSVMVRASATEPINGPQFPDDPPTVAAKNATTEKSAAPDEKSGVDKNAAPDKNAVADAKVETPPPEPLSSDNQTGEKRIAGYPKVETALTTPPTDSTTDDKLGWPFLAVAAGLIASVGANLFLCWIAWGAYGKYRSLARRMNAGASPA